MLDNYTNRDMDFPCSPRSPSYPKIQEKDDSNLINTIDLIMEHQYFQYQLQKIIQNKKLGFHENLKVKQRHQYYTAEDDLVEELVDIINGTVETKLSQALTKQLINVSDEIQAIKKDLFNFMNQQGQKSDQLKKQMNKFMEQLKRKANTNQIISNIGTNTQNKSIVNNVRWVRSNGIYDSLQGSNTTSNGKDQNRSFYTQLMSLKKQIDGLKENKQDCELLKLFQEQFSQFKLQSKVAIETIKHETKKLSVQMSSLSKEMNPKLKQQLEITVKRQIAAQLRTYASYCEEISLIKNSIEELENKFYNTNHLNDENFTRQIKSLWNVLCDMKKTIEILCQNCGVHDVVRE